MKGAPPLVKRLVSQLEAKGMAPGMAVSTAVSTLQRAGNLKPGTVELTKKGEERQAMGAAGRAKDRAAAETAGAHKPAEYVYVAQTNRAHLRKK